MKFTRCISYSVCIVFKSRSSSNLLSDPVFLRFIEVIFKLLFCLNDLILFELLLFHFLFYSSFHFLFGLLCWSSELDIYAGYPYARSYLVLILIFVLQQLGLELSLLFLLLLRIRWHIWYRGTVRKTYDHKLDGTFLAHFWLALCSIIFFALFCKFLLHFNLWCNFGIFRWSYIYHHFKSSFWLYELPLRVATILPLFFIKSHSCH